jgi:sulfofructose kinase
MKFTYPKDTPYDVVGIGRNSWDRIIIVDTYPARDSKVEAKQIDNQAGGQVATTLVAASRMGLSTRYLGKFGDDAAGRAVRGALARENIDLSESKVVDTVSNQTAFIVVDRKHKTRNVFSYSDPRLKVTTDDFSYEAITSGKILFLGARNPQSMISFARDGRNAGCVIVLDADSTNEGIDELMSLADIVISPESFPSKFTGEKSYQRALQDMAQMGPKIVCCTLGERGCIALYQNEVYECSPPDIEVLDTTGAGDVFQGAFLVGLLEEMPFQKMLQFSSAAAALKCRSLGGQKGIPTRKDVERFLQGS